MKVLPDLVLIRIELQRSPDLLYERAIGPPEWRPAEYGRLVHWLSSLRCTTAAISAAPRALSQLDLNLVQGNSRCQVKAGSWWAQTSTTCSTRTGGRHTTREQLRPTPYITATGARGNINISQPAQLLYEPAGYDVVKIARRLHRGLRQPEGEPLYTTPNA
jgi:hypothetical protein